MGAKVTTIDLAEAKKYFRVDHDDDDITINFLLDAAEGHLREICKPYVDEEGNRDTLPVGLQQAVMLLASHWYDNRGIIGRKGFVNELPHAIDALIACHREQAP